MYSKNIRHSNRFNAQLKPGFTVVELVIAVAIIGILASITLVSYSGWKTSSITAQLKNDLVNAASAMDSYRTFNNSYPASVPSTFTPSKGVTVSGGSSDGKIYCLEAVSSDNASIHYFISQSIKGTGAQSGTCASQSVTPAVPTGLAAVAASGSVINLSWTATTGATSYEIQRSNNVSFSDVTTSTVRSATTYASGSLVSNTTYYYRIRAINSVGVSAFSASVNATTAQSCTGEGQYGTYPNCYAYDSLPVGTSVSGYWSTVPSGYLLEDGSAVSRTTYADLFAAIGTTYGAGDGSTTFNLPDSRGRVAVNKSLTDTEFDTLGEKYGEKNHLWTLAELPSHTHNLIIGNVDDKNWTGYTFTGSIQYPPADGPGQYLNSVLLTVPAGGDASNITSSHNVVQPSIVKLSAIKYSKPPVSNSNTVTTGTSIDGYWSSTIPDGYLVEDGSAVSRTKYAYLFALIGTTYGAGDGVTTFNLPDSRGRVTVNKSSTDSEFDTVGEKYGEKTHTVTVAEMPTHTHKIYLGYIDNLDWNGYQFTGYPQYPPSDGPSQYTPGQATLSTGDGQAYNVIQPSIVKTSIIKYDLPTNSAAVNKTAAGTSSCGYWSTAPSGYLIEDGSAISRTTYSSLFAVIGTTYGVGDGSTTFNLPDSRGRVAVNKLSTDANFDTVGEKYGEKMHKLTIAEMPSHTHRMYFGTVDDQNFSGYLSASQYPPADGTDRYLNTLGQSTVATGGDQSHNVIQPSIVKTCVIQY